MSFSRIDWSAEINAFLLFIALVQIKKVPIYRKLQYFDKPELFSVVTPTGVEPVSPP